jgi:hypothetical protein
MWKIIMKVVDVVITFKRRELFENVLTPLLFTLKVNCVPSSVHVKGSVIIQKLKIFWSLLLFEEIRFCIGE